MKYSSLAILLLACAHAKTTTPPPQSEKAQEEPPQASPKQPVAQKKAKGKAGGATSAAAPGVLSKVAAEQLQSALRERGFDIAPTGSFDAKTQKAVEKFQEREGLAATGMPDHLTLRRLGLDPAEMLRFEDVEGKEHVDN